MPLRQDPDHQRWLRAEASRLAALVPAARTSNGFGWLGPDCRLADPAVQTWIACRMTHVAGLAVLADLPGASSDLVDHGVAALLEVLRDDEDGGWFGAVDPEGSPRVPDGDRKQAYDQAFVVLAGATASAAGSDRGPELLDRAVATLRQRFWDPHHAMLRDSYDRSFTRLSPYRGANANMHAVEALLAAADVTGDTGLVTQAAAVADRVVGVASATSWRIPEHYDEQWNPLPELGADRPSDQFQPYGATVGHGLEWARLLVHLDVAQDAGWHRLDAARALYDRAVTDGWAADGAPGFVYTTDWDGRPVTRTRLHWVCCEAIAAAAVLAQATGEARYEDDYERWWDFTRRHLVDTEQGSWQHELDEHNRPSHQVWEGKPDLYHAVQACLLPLLPLAPSVAGALTLVVE